jgi:acyl carrier protein
MIVEKYGLLPMQQGMLFHHLVAEHSGVDIEQIVINNKESPDIPALERAWQAVVDKHPALRTSFRWEGFQGPVQQIHDEVPIQVEHHHSWDDATFSAFLEAGRRRGFDLRQPPLLRLAFFGSGTGPVRLVWTIHHILLDGRASVIILNEVEQFYDSLLNGVQLDRSSGLPYKPYIQWIEHLDLSGANEFWSNKLRGLTAPTPLPCDPDGLPKENSIHGEIEIELSEEVTSRLRDIARQCNVSLNTIVMGAWAILLGRFSGDPEVLFGAVRTTRGSSVPDTESIVGLFLNTVPARVAVDPATQVAQKLKHLQAEWMWVNLRQYDYTPLTQIKRVSAFPQSQPLFNSLGVFENHRFYTSLVNSQPRWRERDFTLYEHIGLPLALSAFGDDAMRLRMEYDVRRYSKATAARVLAHLARIFESIADSPFETIGHRIEPCEIEAVLEQCNGIRQAVVVAREDREGDKRLVAYLVAEGATGAEAADTLRSVLESKLPDYMVPSAFVFLPELPLIDNGKIDRKALLRLSPPGVAVCATTGQPRNESSNRPSNEIECIVAAAWQDALGIPSVSVNDNFFDLGAHSLTVAEVQVKLQEALGREISLVDLFQFSTVSALAKHLAGTQSQGQFSDRAQRRRLARQH